MGTLHWQQLAACGARLHSSGRFTVPAHIWVQASLKKKTTPRGPLGPLHKTMKGFRRALGFQH